MSLDGLAMAVRPLVFLSALGMVELLLTLELQRPYLTCPDSTLAPGVALASSQACQWRFTGGHPASLVLRKQFQCLTVRLEDVLASRFLVHLPPRRWNFHPLLHFWLTRCGHSWTPLCNHRKRIEEFQWYK